MGSPLHGWIDRLISARWWLLGAALLVVALAYAPSRYLQFDRGIERLFSPRDPVLAPYQRLKRDFGGNEIVLVVYRDEQLLDPDGSGIRRQHDVARRIETVPGIADVLSLAKISELLERLDQGRSLGGVLDRWRGKEVPAMPAILDPDRPMASRFRELFTGYTHSVDGQTAAIVCMLKPHGDDAALNVPRETTIAELERIAAELPDGVGPGVLAGEPVMLAQGFSLLEADGRRLGTWTLVLLGLTILIFFHSLRWLLLPLAVVQWSLILTRAILVLSGLELSMVSSMLSAVITVVGVATVMHLTVHMRELRTLGHSQLQALKVSAATLWAPIVGAILTDVAGFGSLLFASVQPVRDFGLMMSLGSLLVIPAMILLTPAIVLAGAGMKTPKPGFGEISLGKWLVRSIDTLHARPKTVMAVLVVVATFASAGALRLEVETDFTRNFRRGSSVVQAYELVESRLGGAGVMDLTIPAPSPAVLNEDYLNQVRRLEEQLRNIRLPNTQGSEPALTKVISAVDALDVVNADATLAALTPTPELRYQALAAAMPVFMRALRQPIDAKDGRGRLRIMLRARERQPAEQKQWLIAEVGRLADEAFPPVHYREPPEVTGFFVLLTNLIQSLLRDQWVTFGAAATAIITMIWIGFRSWKYALIAMIPNAVPIYMVMGLLGWLGLRMNMGAAMIAAVSMGLSVDSSIHYFSAFRRARREGLNVHAALVRCQQSVGLAMIFSTFALMVGFTVLVTSEFVPTIYFGALMSLSMLGGLLGNLIVLPLLLSWIETDSPSPLAPG